MTQEQLDRAHGRTCPTCGEPLQRNGELLSCKQHGLFFRYGPRLLVHVARAASTQAPLMPWQTLADGSPR